ncbi:MAG TPA: copper resistance CopC family protein [Caulobacteraceae bacterium]
MRALMIGFALALVLGRTAAAHAFLDHAEPRVGSSLAAPPAQIRLWFTQGLEPTLCVVKVDGPAGFGGAEPQAAGADPHELVVVLRKPVPAGRYVVHWRVVSVDSHMTQGDFSFQVRP